MSRLGNGLFYHYPDNMMKPVILAGTSRSGKTTLARRLQQETGYSLVSGDALICTFESIYPQLNISHEGDWTTVCRTWEDFILVYLNHMITYENIPFIFDTFHLLPEQVARHKLHEKYHVLFFGYPQMSIEKKLHTIRTYPTGHYDWTTEQSDEELSGDVASFIERSRYLEQECRRYDLPFIDTGHDFHAALDKAYALIKTE